jgi:hypothetical protein
VGASNALRARIREGRFVRLWDLLPGGRADEGRGRQAAHLAVGANGKIAVEEEDDGAFSYPHWVEAWAAYMGVVADVAPGQLPGMAAYMGLVAHMYRQFGKLATFEYDRRFRAIRGAEGLVDRERRFPWGELHATTYLQATAAGQGQGQVARRQFPRPRPAPYPQRTPSFQRTPQGGYAGGGGSNGRDSRRGGPALLPGPPGAQAGGGLGAHPFRQSHRGCARCGSGTHGTHQCNGRQ